MKRIREDLKKQQALGSAEGSSVNSRSEKAATTEGAQRNTDSAVDTLRQIANVPNQQSDPTAQSMVAIAGAVTALASAIQFRLTDSAEPKSTEEETVSGDRSSEIVRNAAVATPTGSSMVAADADEPQTDHASASLDVTSQANNPGQEILADSFDDTFFDNDESDVAGAYTVLPPASEPEESYGQWFRRVVVRNKWITWFTAFYVHWLTLVLMMVVFVHGTEQTANLLLNGAFADSPPTETESFEMSVTEPTPEVLEPEKTVVSDSVAAAVTRSELAEEPLTLNDSLLKQFGQQDSASESKAATDSDRHMESVTQTLTTPSRSVSQGSFSVWTEPEYPTAGEPYRIIVQIQLPPNTENYHLRDLNGVVVGSDGYRKAIPGSNQKPLQIVDGCVRLVIPIVSADEHVKDTIFIRSKLLKETQKLLLEF